MTLTTRSQKQLNLHEKILENKSLSLAGVLVGKQLPCIDITAFKKGSLSRYLIVQYSKNIFSNSFTKTIINQTETMMPECAILQNLRNQVVLLLEKPQNFQR